MHRENGFFPGKSIRLYPEENAIGFVFKDEEWATRFYLESLLRKGKTAKLKGSEVIFYSKKSANHT